MSLLDNQGELLTKACDLLEKFDAIIEGYEKRLALAEKRLEKITSQAWNLNKVSNFDKRLVSLENSKDFMNTRLTSVYKKIKKLLDTDE